MEKFLLVIETAAHCTKRKTAYNIMSNSRQAPAVPKREVPFRVSESRQQLVMGR